MISLLNLSESQFLLSDRFKTTLFVVLSLSCVQLFATPWTAGHQASLSFTVSQSFLKFMSIESVMLSHLLLPSSPFALNLSQHQGLFQRISCPLQICKWMNEWMDGMVRCWSNLPYDVTCDIAQEVWREKILKAKRRSPRFLSFLKHFLTFSTYNTGSLELPRIIQIQAKNQSIQKIKTETLL